MAAIKANKNTLSRKLICIAFIFSLFTITSTAQVDSIHSIFKSNVKIKLPIRYSYLQWDIGYKGFFLDNQYLNGISADILGAVFNYNVHVAFGYASSVGGNPYVAPQGSYTIRSFRMIYIKAEPLLFPEQVFNLSAPIVFGASSFNYSSGTYTGFRRRGQGTFFTSISGGLNFIVNLYKRLSLGIGADYRFGLGTKNADFFRDYDNYSVNAFFRFRVNTRKTRAGIPNDRNDYYSPPK